MKKIVYFILLLLIEGVSYAQRQGQALIDSLLQELPKAKEDTNKVNLLNDLSGVDVWQMDNHRLYYAQYTMGLVKMKMFC